MPPSAAGNLLAAAPSKGHAVDCDTPAADDDRALVAAVRAGDRDAFDRLVERYGGRLHASLLHLARGDAELAAEFTQEAFVRAFERLDQFAGASSFYTWIWRLARNRALDLLALRRPVATDNEVLAAAPGRSPDPSERSERHEMQTQVRAALAALPEDMRAIILLRDFDGLDYHDIADALAVPEGTVKSRLNRARTQLRAALETRLAGAWP